MHIFEPILKKPRTQVQISKEGPSRILCCVDDPSAAGSMHPEHLYANLLAVVTFLGDVFNPIEEVVAHMGRLLWTGAALCGTIVEDCLVRSIPDDLAALVAYQATVEATREFERKLLARYVPCALGNRV